MTPLLRTPENLALRRRIRLYYESGRCRFFATLELAVGLLLLVFFYLELALGSALSS